MAKVALVNPISSRDRFYTGHLGLSFISSYLKKQGHDVLYLDVNHYKNPDSGVSRYNIARRAANFGAEYVGVTTCDTRLYEVRDSMRYLHKHLKKAIFIAGGPASTRNPEKILKLGFHVAVVGDGIPTIQHVIDAEGKTPGMCYSTTKKGFVDNGFAEYNPSLWEIDTSVLRKGTTGHNVISSVGCRYKKCKYCTITDAFPKIKRRPVKKIIDDMKALNDYNGSLKTFSFDDDNFLNSPKRLVEIVDAMEKAGLPQKISFQARADDVLRAKKELRYAKKKVNEVRMGVESFLDEQLERWDKGITAKQNHRAIEFIANLGDLPGVDPKIYIILGDMETDMDEIKRVCDIFVDHPEYMLMMPKPNLYVYPENPRGDYSDYPEFMRLYERFFAQIGNNNNTPSTWESQMNIKHKGKRVIKARKKELEKVFRKDVHKIIADQTAGKLSFEEAEKELMFYSDFTLHLLTHLYCRV